MHVSGRDVSLQDEEIWSLSESDDDAGQGQSTYADKNTPVWKLLFFLFFWQSIFKVSNNAFTSLLRFLKYFLVFWDEHLLVNHF